MSTVPGPHGVIVVDKPAGMSSAHVVNVIKRVLNVARVGHTGTLDPIATGVLPLCVGEGTKLAGYLLAEEKRYLATFALGAATDTLDRTGQITARADAAAVAAITDAQLARAVQQFVGEIAQMPPMFSALQVNGERLYKAARRGEDVPRQARPVTVFAATICARTEATVQIDVHCSKGTYIRSLIDDIGKVLGVGAHMTELRRTQSGRFTLAQALPQAAWQREAALAQLVPLGAMTDLPQLVVADSAIRRVRDGKPSRLLDLLAAPADAARAGTSAFLLTTTTGELLAVATAHDGSVRYERGFVGDRSDGNAS